MTAPRHLLEIDDLAADELGRVLDLAADPVHPNVLSGRTVGLYFEKQSLRTRHSCEAAVVQLGGHPVTFRAEEVGTDSREPLTDIARVLSGYHAAIAGRVYRHGDLEAWAAAATVPVVNLLSDLGHPCQAIADLLTMRERWGDLAGRTVCWVGDYNNVARSLCLGAAAAGMRLRIASPDGYGPTDEDLDRLAANGLAEAPVVTTRPHEAAEGADAVHTDVWASMGQEDEAEARRQAFEGFRVDDDVMAAAAPDALFMHCLPAHRGEEVAASVVDGPQSVVIPQAHNRLHAFRGVLRFLLEEA
ncbi:MAG TPA: ornithine carbamoyltransferase [Acidimicrobiales bacterium]|nr:ornithine carbamoyltransferase [Acidimicrobiales bacterium]